MGNEQSTQKKRPKTNADKKVKNGELNGHAVPTPDGTELVASKAAAVEQKSEPPPVTITNEPKPPKKEEVDSCKLNGPAHVETTPEQKTTVAKDAEPPKTVPKPSEDEVTNFFGKMFKKKSEPVKPALESNDSVDALVDLIFDLVSRSCNVVHLLFTFTNFSFQKDKVFINSDQKEILEEVAEKLKLQLVNAIPAQPKSPSSLTKNISMESSSANVEDVTCLEVLPDLHTEQEPVAVAEEPLSEEPVTRKASEIHVGHLKFEEPPTADAKVPEDEEPKTVDAEQALLEDKELLQMVESIISDEREQLACENVPMCEATKHLIDEPISKKLMKADEESWVIIEEPARPPNVSAHSGRSEECKCNSAESTQILSQLKSICTKALEDSSYKPFSVDVCADESIIHITIEVCPDEFTCLNKDPVDIKTSTQPEPEPEPEGETLEPSPVEVTEENNPSEDIKAAEKTVMNFFKTFVTPTKTSKEAKATPDASKEQSQKETPPAPSTNAQETPKAPPPPPPPAPPKMESKAEPVVKKEETSATKAAAAASTKAEGSAKTKTKDSSFSKLFRPKVLLGKVVSKVQAATSSGASAKTSRVPVVVEEKKPVEVQVDASKSSTLEASAKPEEPPAPKPEEKKQEKKSTFGKMFKPKVLLGQVSTRIQAAASSAAASISLMSARSAPEAKKETPAPPPVAEAAPVVKAKEEPKPPVPAPQTAPDNKSIGSTDNSSPNMPRKLEKRNSLQLFFKNLGQKRQSDAGVQTDPVAPEKSK
ncbi:breast carcinoma-amplified sequence 1 [Rhinichthys klamathensis goyatoka]|uniref:breast carcinoma-amplified sequence 1 n=1 Tax=Rhinichthys klamathensis goyatoka TaxID=3034132 RepID=UPI0024B4D1CF|nr:breast carcinoma-amplified sequence 1 [Rhinichthys klamathensis goyatoka]